MPVHTLHHIPINQIAEAFNKAFEKYFIPIQLNEQQFRDKIKSDNILLEHSVGVTIDHQLAGFILIGINPETNIAYNAGTGTIPLFRGRRLTEKMYSYLLPHLDKFGKYNHMLEVICQNQKARAIYEAVGYSVTKKVNCYNGKVSETKNSNHTIRAIEIPKATETESFWNHKPTYQNSMFCIQNLAEKHNAFGAFDNEKLIGYIIFDKHTLRIKQFGVDKHYRNKGLGNQLFYEVQKQKPENELFLINIDANDLETNSFLQRMGFSNILQQYEMELKTK